VLSYTETDGYMELEHTSNLLEFEDTFMTLELFIENPLEIVATTTETFLVEIIFLKPN